MIDLGNTYISYIIEVWIFLDTRYNNQVRNSSYDWYNNSSQQLFEYGVGPNWRFPNILKTDGYDFRLTGSHYYINEQRDQRIQAIGTKAGCTTAFYTLLNEMITPLNWSRFIMESRYNNVTGKTTYSMSTVGRFVKYYGSSENIIAAESAPATTLAGSCSMSKIMFCAGDSNMTGCSTGVNVVSAFYKDLRIWDARYTNAAGVLNSHL